MSGVGLRALGGLAQLTERERERVVATVGAQAAAELNAAWELWAHAGQLAPAGDWRVWLMQAGRGFGKTRAGAEWVRAMARAVPGARIALVGATVEDARKVMVEGPSGVVAVARPADAVVWRPTSGEVRFGNGTVATLYSAAAPEKLRGPEHHFAWADELAKWSHASAWDNLTMGLRLGTLPRALVTTTPRATALMRRVRAAPGTVVTRGRTRDNAHLPEAFVAAMEASYGATRLGRQELDGELIDDVAGALWPRALIERQRAGVVPELTRVVVGVDPPAGVGGDACGIVAAGLGRDGHGYVIEDASVTGASPERWAHAVVACAARVSAERVVAEANQGGAMVEQVLRAAQASLPIRLVHATRGKAARAEPVAALYERGRVWHARAFPALEDELAGLVAGGGYEGPGRSPDRADACVWALTALMLDKQGEVRVRTM
ncbi:phage terminase large subunit-like protein [Sphingomonas sp. BE138]|uniref:DNA-packaging protein n=1 Tax=Sphingomonas sp. BE138 TaxID=2817845 RepID=UPI0028543EEC|nr:terminase family protein [Sphingomonas sp. BE138]MDR6788911.1 phage terminase large subunit-like protein [Sphingomonas sp. BE138]